MSIRPAWYRKLLEPVFVKIRYSEVMPLKTYKFRIMQPIKYSEDNVFVT